MRPEPIDPKLGDGERRGASSCVVQPRRPPAWLTIAVSFTLGASVWALSPWLAGHREPWDAGGYYYVLALGIAGFVAGLLAPRPLWAHYLGAFAGQLAYEVIFLPVGALILLGAAFLLGYSVVFLVAAAAAGLLRARLAPRPSPITSEKGE